VIFARELNAEIWIIINYFINIEIVIYGYQSALKRSKSLRRGCQAILKDNTYNPTYAVRGRQCTKKRCQKILEKRPPCPLL